MDKTCAKCGMLVRQAFNICPGCGSREFLPPKGSQPQPQPAPAPAPAAPPQGSNSSLLKILGVAGVLFCLVVLGMYVNTQLELSRQEAAARREAEARREQMQMEMERQRLEAQTQAEVERMRREAQLQMEREQQAEREKQQAETRVRQAEAAKRAEELERHAIGKIEKTSRASLYNEGRVLQLRNLTDTPVDFQLKCCTVNDDCKTMFVVIPGRGTKEIGFLEGWSGNFASGETCKAIYQEEVLWEIRFR